MIHLSYRFFFVHTCFFQHFFVLWWSYKASFRNLANLAKNNCHSFKVIIVSRNDIFFALLGPKWIDYIGAQSGIRMHKQCERGHPGTRADAHFESLVRPRDSEDHHRSERLCENKEVWCTFEHLNIWNNDSWEPHGRIHLCEILHTMVYKRFTSAYLSVAGIYYMRSFAFSHNICWWCHEEKYKELVERLPYISNTFIEKSNQMFEDTEMMRVWNKQVSLYVYCKIVLERVCDMVPLLINRFLVEKVQVCFNVRFIDYDHAVQVQCAQ